MPFDLVDTRCHVDPLEDRIPTPPRGVAKPYASVLRSVGSSWHPLEPLSCDRAVFRATLNNGSVVRETGQARSSKQRMNKPERTRSRAIDNSARLSARTELRKRLGSRLTQLTHGKSDEDLARAWGVGLGTVRNLRSGQSEPNMSTALVIAHGLGLRSIDELLAPTGAMLIMETLANDDNDGS